MPLPAQQVCSAEFDRRFFSLPRNTQRKLEARIDFLGTHLRNFRHQRLQGVPAFKLRVGDYRVIYRFDVDANRLELVSLDHRSKAYRAL